MSSDRYAARGRLCYILAAAFEYFISLLITDAFLINLLKANGVSDAACGVIYQITVFAFSAQIFSLFVHKTRFKRFVTLMNLANQVMFVLLYLVPGVRLAQTVKAILLVALFLGGQILANMAAPYKTAWLMSYVPDDSRGRFSANKEIVSLAGGTLFSLVMGAVSDHYERIGEPESAFAVCGVTIVVLAVLHTVSLLAVKETGTDAAPEERVQKEGLRERVRGTLADGAVMKIVLVDVLWHFISGISLGFFSTYKREELAFSMTFIALLSAAYAVVRIAFSRFFGSLADKRSWARMLPICFAVAAASFAVGVFTYPTAGSLDIPLPFLPAGTVFRVTYAKVSFTLFYCLYAVSMAGINSGLLNIVFDYVPHGKSPEALGVKFAFGGFAALAAGLIGSAVVSTVQHNGNTLFGVPVYAQQVLSGIAFVLCLVLLVYMRRVVLPLKTIKERAADDEA